MSKGNEKGSDIAKAEGGSFSFFEKDGAYFRRHPGMFGVQDVLRGGKWADYDGEDQLAPAMFGDEVSDPTGGKGDDGEGEGSKDGRTRATAPARPGWLG